MEIFLIIMIVLCVLFLIALITMIFFTVRRDKKHLPNEQIMQNHGAKSAILIVQPSIHKGNVSMTNTIAVGLNEMGYNVTINRPGTKLEYDLNDYDLVVFGSGVYMGKPSSTLIEYLKKNNNFENKEVFIYLTGIDNESSVEFKKITKHISKSNQISTLKLNKNELDKASDFIRNNFSL